MKHINIRIVKRYDDMGGSDHLIEYDDGIWGWKTLIEPATPTQPIREVTSKHNTYELKQRLCTLLGYDEVVFDEYPTIERYKFNKNEG